MTEQKIEKMNRFFADRIAGCDRHSRELKADERGDEAVLDKVRANIYDVFRTVLSAAVKAGRGDPEAVSRFYSEKLEVIPAGWADAYEKARTHNDAVKMQIESIKLDAVADIREYFNRIREEET